jgi:murein DD-endopeptidase MepM/ murein hydrolase activator NlpD
MTDDPQRGLPVEPLYDPNDTPPHGLRAVQAPAPITDRIRRRRRGGLSNALLVGAAALITTFAAVLYLADNGERTPRPAPTGAALLPTVTTRPTDLPTAPPTDAPPAISDMTVALGGGVPPDVVAELLRAPGRSAPPADGLYRAQNPFTIAPARSRSGVISYRIQPGDTLEKIAERFGLSQDTIVWNNDGIFVNRLQPGDALTILPEDGVLHRTRQEQTIQAIAEQYKVSPFKILDSDYNPILRAASATTLLPAGMTLMVPGGVSDKKAIYWNPGISIEGGSAGGGSVSFGGGPGSCGAQPNVGGTGTLVVPLPPNYVVTRGFLPYHTGIDLSAPSGTTIFAADGGTVIFAGWSNWGYGNSVVIAHGRLITLYGHMSRLSVNCGQQVSQGTPIGAVGNTGNSRGAHLHFEVRIGEVPDNPESYLSF